MRTGISPFFFGGGGGGGQGDLLHGEPVEQF